MIRYWRRLVYRFEIEAGLRVEWPTVTHTFVLDNNVLRSTSTTPIYTGGS